MPCRSWDGCICAVHVEEGWARGEPGGGAGGGGRGGKWRRGAHAGAPESGKLHAST